MERNENERNEEEIIKNFYEAFFIINPNINLFKLDKTVKELENTINSRAKNILEIDHIGVKQLAYAVKGQNHGYYIYIPFKLEDTEENIINKIQLIQNKIKQDNNIIKYIVVRTSEEELNAKKGYY